MAAVDSTTTFPVEIDRSAFGHWLSGFVDGEGCFLLKLYKVKRWSIPGARFELLLRADDLPILEQIKEFLGVGCIGHKTRGGNAKPAAHYYVSAATDLAHAIVPHFERYPLRAKKHRDFLIWREAVLLIHLNFA